MGHLGGEDDFAFGNALVEFAQILRLRRLVLLEWQEAGDNCIQYHSAAPDVGGLSVVSLMQKVKIMMQTLEERTNSGAA